MFVVIPKHPKISKNKPHPYAEEFLIDKKNLGFTPYQEERLKNRSLAKYCPKYYKRLQLIPKSAKTILALKRIKKVSKIQDFFQERVKNPWRLILQNKFKSVEHYNYSFHLRSSRKKHRAFSRLTTLSLYNDGNREEVQKIGAYLWRWQLRQLGGFVNLEFLDVILEDEEDFIALKKLNSLTRLLSALKTLKITYKSSPYDNEKVGFLRTIVQYKNILKHITHLIIGDIKREEDCENFEILPDYCKNLRFLSFEISHRVSGDFLQKLGEFENLECIQIVAAEDLSTFVENFIAPDSLKFAKFDFDSTSCRYLCEDLLSMDIDAFLKTPKNQEIPGEIKRFSQQLKNLVSLKIEIQDEPGEAHEALLFIALAFLQDIQNLEDLNLLFLNDEFRLSEPISSITFSLASFFNLVPNICSQLKYFTLKVPQTYSIDFESDSKSQNIALSQLKSFKLIAHLSSAQETMKRIFATFPDHGVSINLNFPIVSNQDFIELLGAAREHLRKRKIMIKMHIYKLDLESFDKQFSEFFKNENTSVIKNVKIEVESSLITRRGPWKLFIKKISKMFASVYSVGR